jgi:hypothetical protein
MADSKLAINSSKDMGGFESRLKSLLAPVDPDPGYVQKLKNKLIKKTEIYLEQDNGSLYPLFVIIALIGLIFFYLLFGKMLKK